METTDFVSYDLALKLKACGFDEPCEYYYTSKGRIVFNKNNPSCANNSFLDEIGNEICSAVSLWHAQKWLREKKDWHIIVEPQIWESLTYEFKLWHKFRGYENANRGFYFSSYERALSAGISAALELIKKGE